MVWRSGLVCLFVVLALKAAFAQTFDSYSVEIDLQEQTAYLVRDGRVVLSTPIASGRYGHLTEPGSFKIIDKERSHFSTLYGKIVDASGRTIVSDADADMPVPRGGRFIPAPMRYFMRFNESIGMHAGYLPGYPASHGCVRLPEENAIAFFNAVNVGTPVTVFGRTPRGRSTEEARLRPQGYRPQFVDPRFDQRLTAPWWWR
jgi:lipoprotein-anchoring transpeptidase ErfK/SrfK